MASVCVVFSPDGEPWFNYFENYLQRVFSDIVIERCEESHLFQPDGNSSKTRAAMKQSKVNIFIISPGYLQFCIDFPEVNLKDLSSHAKVMIFLCGTSLDDFVIEDANGYKIADRLPVFEKQCLLSFPQHDEMLKKVISILESEHKPDKSKDESLICRPTPKPNGKRKRRSKGFKFIPREVNCEGTSDVIISFDELVENEESEIRVEVEIEANADDEGSTRVTAAYLNPYTCSFRAPERRAGTVKVCVYLQGKALGTEELMYSSTTLDAISGIHQIYIRQIDELCSQLSSDRLLELDGCLAMLLHDSSKGVIPVGSFEYFHRVHRFQSSDVSEFELPTIFHLAAKYGLQELCQQFTDLPDARYSFCTYNADRKLPEDLARLTNHSEIANMLENLRESDVFQKLYDSYIIMNRGEMSPEYLVQSSKTVEGGSDDDYEDVPTDADMSAMTEQRFKSDGLSKSDFGFNDEDENRRSCSFVEKYLQPMENPYECRLQTQKLLAPVKLIEGKSTIPRNQQELIQIMEQVKNKQLTMTDAEVLFKEWKIRHQKKPASMKHKEDQLAKLREEAGKAQKEKKETFTFSQFLGKKSGGTSTNQCIPEIMPGAKHRPAKSEVLGDRTSSASNSSRESTCSIRSRNSTTSGIDIDDTIQEEVAAEVHPKPRHNNRKSVHLQKLANELSSPGALEPPPLPPRVVGTTSSNSSIPLPHLERAPSPRSMDSLDKSHLSRIVELSGSLRAQTENPNRLGTDSPKNFIHQESMPELHKPPTINAPRKASLPNIALSSSHFPHKNVVSAVPEEDSETEGKQTPPRGTPKPPRRKTEGLNDELRRVIQQKAEGMQAGNKATSKVPSALPRDKESTNSDTTNNLASSLRPLKKLPVVPSKGAK